MLVIVSVVVIDVVDAVLDVDVVIQVTFNVDPRLLVMKPIFTSNSTQLSEVEAVLTLSNPTSGRGLFSRGGGPQGPPLEINEGASGEQDSRNTIFNTHKIRIVFKI